MKLTAIQIIEQVKISISPLIKSWVLFSNGTYIIFEDGTIINTKEKAVEIMKEFGPAHADSSSGDVTIRLSQSNGWTVGGNYCGMYTYVHHSELDEQNIINPTDSEVAFLGRKKREQDSKELRIIYIQN